MARKNKMKMWRKMAEHVNLLAGEKHQGRKFKNSFTQSPPILPSFVHGLLMREPTYAAFDKARKQIKEAVEAVVAENTAKEEEQKPSPVV